MGVDDIPVIPVITEEKVVIGMYQGKPVLTIWSGKFPFGFGKAKAKLIVKYFDAIKEFANS